MTLIEAIAVYLTLAHQKDRTDQQNRAFAAAWGVIFREGDRIAHLRPKEDMSKFDPAMIEALASAWASIDGKLDKFFAGKGKPIDEQPGGHYEGYIAEAEEMAARLLKRGFIITPTGARS